MVVLGAVTTVSVTGELEFEMDPTRGKIQAQGSDFSDAGTGSTVQFNSIGGFPLWAMETVIEGLRTKLTETQEKNREEAFSELWTYVQTRPWAPVFERTFPKALNGPNPQQATRGQSRTCQKNVDCRIDFTMPTGRIF